MGRDSGAADFLAGFVIGGLVGAAVGLIFAPQTGEETRTQLREKSIELKEVVEDLSAEARKHAEKLQETAGASLGGHLEKGQELLQAQKSRVEEAIEAGKEAAAKKKEELRAKLESGKSKPVAEA